MCISGLGEDSNPHFWFALQQPSAILDRNGSVSRALVSVTFGTTASDTIPQMGELKGALPYRPHAGKRAPSNLRWGFRC
jgi:hypothetical protein